MGRYIDWSHVVGRYKDAATLAEASNTGSYWLNMAEYEIDGALGARYTVPFSPAPLQVQDLCIDLTYFKMTVGKATKKDLKKYIDERIAGLIDGTIVLVTSAGNIQGDPNAAWSENSYHTSFGPDDPVNFRVDSNWITDVQDLRGQFRGSF